jgi:N-acylneuraminate cytidylyltransferase
METKKEQMRKDMKTMIKAPIETLAIIPARGGSKGIPRKNVKELLGKPLIGVAIENCHKSVFINRTVVSTDDDEVCRISEMFGAEVVNRPPEICGDNASSESALLHVLEHLEENEGYSPDLIVFVQCTSPLILPKDIDGTIRTLLDNDADVGFAVTKSYSFLWTKDVNGYAKALNHNKDYRPMRQDMIPQFAETGAIYAIRTQGFLKQKHRFFGKISMHEIPRKRAIDINDSTDFQIAEAFLREYRRQVAPNIVKLFSDSAIS